MTLTSLTTPSGAVVQAAGADGTVTPGVLGFVVVALLGVATYLLIRSMNRQIKRIDLPPQEKDPDTAPEEPVGDDPVSDGPVSGEPDRP